MGTHILYGCSDCLSLCNKLPQNLLQKNSYLLCPWILGARNLDGNTGTVCLHSMVSGASGGRFKDRMIDKGLKSSSVPHRLDG